MKVTLSKPIQAHDEDISEVTFREPTGKDTARCGVVFNVTTDGDQLVIAAGPMHKMIAALAGIPISSVDQMSGKDWNTCAMVILPLFVEGETT